MRDSATPPPSPSFLKDALWYAAAAGAGLVPTTTDAQVVYTDLDPDLLIEDTEVEGDGAYTGLSADFDGDGDNEILFIEEDGRDYTQFIYDVDPSDGPDAITGVVGGIFSNFLYPYPLSVGAVIGPGNPNLIVDPTYTYGTFEFEGFDPVGWLGTDAYMGVQFTLDGADTHYGWVRVEIPADGGVIIVKEMAYEATPDTPIEAGAIGTAIEPGPDGTPGTHALTAAYPNPSVGNVQFTLEVAAPQAVHLAVYDALGREVALLHDGTLTAGTAHRFTLNDAHLRAGVYVIRATGETFSDARPVTLLK